MAAQGSQGVNTFAEINRFDGEQKGQNLEIRSVGLFPFDGDALISEKLYADVSPLLPFMPWLEDAS